MHTQQEPQVTRNGVDPNGTTITSLTHEQLSCIKTILPTFKPPPKAVVNRYLREAARVVASQPLLHLYSDQTASHPAVCLSLLSLGAQYLCEDDAAIRFQEAAFLVVIEDPCGQEQRLTNNQSKAGGHGYL